MPYYPQQQEQKPPDHPSEKRNILRRAILCASILLIAYGAVRLISYGADLAASRRTAQELREAAEETDPAETPAVPAIPETAAPMQADTAVPAAQPVQTTRPEASPALTDKLPVVQYPNGYELVQRIRKLRKKSEYVIGWITMDDLDEPVALKDNSFFLNHDASGKKNVNGAIFMDEDTSLLTRPYTILLYGHNMKTGAMFGNLKKYEEFSYCFRHRYIQFDTLYEEGRYVIFAVETISLTPGTARYLSLAALQSDNRNTRKEAIRTLMNHSLHDLMPDVDEEDQLLLLITCVGDDDERLVVAARRLRDGEQ